MKKILITLALISSQFISINAQSIVTKYQNIPSKGIEAIAPLDKIYEGSPNLNVRSGGIFLTQSSVLIEIVASGENIPSRILSSLLNAGEFDLGFSIMDNQLLFHNHYPSTNIRFKGEEYILKLSYKIFVPKGLVDHSDLPIDTASR